MKILIGNEWEDFEVTFIAGTDCALVQDGKNYLFPYLSGWLGVDITSARLSRYFRDSRDFLIAFDQDQINDGYEPDEYCFEVDFSSAELAELHTLYDHLQNTL